MREKLRIWLTISAISVLLGLCGGLYAKSPRPKEGSAFHGHNVPEWNTFKGGWQWKSWEANQLQEWIAKGCPQTPGGKPTLEVMTPDLVAMQFMLARIEQLEETLKAVLWAAADLGLNVAKTLENYEDAQKSEIEATRSLAEFIDQLAAFNAHKPNKPGKPIRPDGRPPEQNDWYL